MTDIPEHIRARPLAGAARERYLAHARRAPFRYRLAEAMESLTGLRDLVHAPYVAFSCGKDSTVLAHLALTVLPRIPLRFMRSGESHLLHDVDGMCAFFRAGGATVEEVLFDRVFSAGWSRADWETSRRAGRKDHEQMTATHDAVLLGLRMDESRARAITLRRHQSPDLPIHCYRLRTGPHAGLIRCCPLARWSVDDVGAYCALHDLPLLAWYHHHESGLGARTTARLTGDAVRQYTLTYLRHQHAEAFRLLAVRFPELRSFC